MNNRIKDLRGKLGWSREKLADALGVSRQTVISIERGKYDRSLPLGLKIAAVFERPIEDIFLPEASA